jgi:ABC-type cobalamin transport system ATPase subunit
MSHERRQHEVMVRLNDAELARLDELRPAVTARAVYLRNLLHEPPNREDVADHKQALAILSAMARAGKVTAAIALERALRHAPDGGELDDELDRILRG